MISLSSEPKVIVHIPAFNEKKTTARVILLAQENVDKVVFCDDDSTDMISEVAMCLGGGVVCELS